MFISTSGTVQMQNLRTLLLWKEYMAVRKEPCAYSAWHSMSLFLIGAFSTTPCHRQGGPRYSFWMRVPLAFGAGSLQWPEPTVGSGVVFFTTKDHTHRQSKRERNICKRHKTGNWICKQNDDFHIFDKESREASLFEDVALTDVGVWQSAPRCCWQSCMPVGPDRILSASRLLWAPLEIELHRMRSSTCG